MPELETQAFEIVVECDDRKVLVFLEAGSLGEAANFAALAVHRRLDKPARVMRARVFDGPVAVMVRHTVEPLQVLELGAQRRVPCFVGLRATDDPKQRTFDEYLRAAEQAE